ncbi:conserved hypothetical protein [Burkholderia sp. H160]|nr:conserved hypothetical protein [Burkholderia sp. H160]
MKIFADEGDVSNGLQASIVGSAAAPVRLLGESVAQSIFHEPWWLDIATGGHWSMAKVQHGKELLGQLPYYFTRVGGWKISRLPPLTRTLGPVIKPAGLDYAREQHHRQAVTSELIEQLPHFDSFYQLFDSRVEDAIAFSLHGFTVSARYTFQISPGGTAEEAWAQLHCKTRNVIRTAGKKLTVAPVDPPAKFMEFYEANLFERARRNAYGSSVMRELVSAFVERKAGQLLGAYGPRGRLVAAIGIVWDQNAMYYLLTSRTADAHSGAISLLIWTAIQRALERQLTFDFDGFSSAGTYRFLEGFGGTLKQRLSVERMSTMYSIVRTLKHRIVPGSGTVFSHTL